MQMFRNKQLPRSNIKHKLIYDINTIQFIRVKRVLQIIDDNKKKRHMIITKKRNNKIILFTPLQCLVQKKDEITTKPIKTRILYEGKYNELKKEYNDLVNSAKYSLNDAKNHLLSKYINGELFIKMLNEISKDLEKRIDHRAEKKELDKLKKAERKQPYKSNKSVKKQNKQKKYDNVMKPNIDILSIKSIHNLTKADIKDEFSNMLKSNSSHHVYRELSRKYHPDKGGLNEHFNWLKEISEFYRCK